MFLVTRSLTWKLLLGLFFSLTIICVPLQAVTLKGRVYGPDAQPVVDAKVIVTSVSRGKVDQPVTKTDAQGRFTVAIAEAQEGKTTAASVTVRAPGLAVGSGVLGLGQDFILLDRATTLEGSVINERGEPVAGARVRLINVFSIDRLQSYVSENELLNDQFTTQTGADGRWSLSGLPTLGRATFRLEDDAYVYASGFVELGDDITLAEPLIARPASRITGKVVRPNGQPVAGAEVMASLRIDENGYSSTAISGEDGTYLMKGLPEGAAQVSASLPSGDALPSMVTGIVTKTGETVEAPTLTLAPGVPLEARIVDAESGEPLPGGRFYARSDSGTITSPRSDENGRIVVHVRPEKTTFSLNSAPRGYSLRGSTHEPQEIEVPKELAPGAAPPTVTFRMAKGLMLSGTAIDEAGKPATGARILSSRGGTGTTVDENGHWSLWSIIPDSAAGAPVRVPPDAAGRAGASLQSLGIKTDSEWEIVQPKQINPQDNNPIALRLRRAPLLTVAGRVITPNGVPVPGAVVEYRLREQSSSNMSTTRGVKRVSDEKGQYEFSRIRPSQQVWVSVDKTGFRFRSGGQLSQTARSVTISDFVMEPLTAVVAGRVVDGKGSPVAGAHVLALESDSFATVVTDQKGEFVLEALPPGPVTVLAAKGRQEFAQARLQASSGPRGTAIATITLVAKKPPAMTDTARAATLIETMRDDMISTPIRMLARVDPDRARELSRRELTTAMMAPEGNIAWIVTALSRHDPKRAEEWGWPRLAQITNRNSQIHAALDLGVAIAASNPTRAKEILTTARGMVDTPGKERGAAQAQANAIAYSRMAAIGVKLKDPSAGELLQSAVKSARLAASGGAKRDESFIIRLREVIEAAASSPEMVRPLIASLSGQEQIRILRDVIPDLALTDPLAARALLQMLGEFFAPRLAMPEAGDTNRLPEEGEKTTSAAAQRRAYEAGQNVSRARLAFIEVAPAVIRAIGKDDPAGALEIARQAQPGPLAQQMTVDLPLAEAAPFQKPALALALFREALARTSPDSLWYFLTDKDRPYVLALAYEFDPKFGAELFGEMRDRYLPLYAETVRRRQDFAQERTFTALAFHYAVVEPAQSRLWLEKEFFRLKTSTLTASDAPPPSPDRGQSMPPLAPAAFLVADAMVAVNIDRALEMWKSIPATDEAARQSNLIWFIGYLLSPEAERSALKFKRLRL